MQTSLSCSDTVRARFFLFFFLTRHDLAGSLTHSLGELACNAISQRCWALMLKQPNKSLGMVMEIAVSLEELDWVSFVLDASLKFIAFQRLLWWKQTINLGQTSSINLQVGGAT